MLNFLDFSSFSGPDSWHDLWIGLYDPDNFNNSDESSNCGCGSDVTSLDCTECRNRFVWVDGTPTNSDFAPWHGSEPQFWEACVRMTDNDFVSWGGYPCSNQIDYVCSRGNTVQKNAFESMYMTSFPFV